MSNKKMSKEAEDMILTVIDKIVTNTGYPIVSMALKAAGISRENIRHMEAKGLVEAIDLNEKNTAKKGATGTLVKSYYTHRVYPKVLIERDKKLKEAQEQRLLDNIGKALEEETKKKAAKHHKHHKEAAAK